MSGAAPQKLRITFVVAAAENGIIGRDGAMPWRISSDLRYFRRVTIGKPVIMGRKTFEAVGKPLDNRDSIVLTRDPGYAVPEGVHVVTSPEAALSLARRLAQARGSEEIAVIGGAEVYRLMLPHCDRIYLTRVHASPEGDASFAIDPALWTEVDRSDMPRTDRDMYGATFITYDRR